MENNTQSYPCLLQFAIRDIVETENYNVNDVLGSFQFLFSEAKLNAKITWKMRQNVMDLLVNNNAPKWSK